MELQLLEEMDIEFGSGCEFELPKYMTRLSPENIVDDINDKNKIVIAAGSDPQDGKITLVTLTGRVMVFDARKFHIPDGPAVPTSGGREVFLENVDGRWPGEAPGFHVEVEWMLEKSTNALKGATLQINYLHENNSP